METLTDQLHQVKDALERYVDTKMNGFIQGNQKNQQALDELIAENQGKSRIIGGHLKTFGDAFAAEMHTQFEAKQAEIKNFQNSKDAKLSFTLKEVGTMITGAHLTGDGQASYRMGQNLVPSARVNFRDLIPTVQSPTGIYVTYKETGGEGAIDDQVEGQPKAQVDYDFTEVKNVSGYIAGFARFSKQMMYHLPWLQTTLTRLLLRDFYKKENAKFYAAVAGAATGFDTTTETDDAKAIIDVLMGRLDADFNNSFILVRNSQKGAILKLLYENGLYLGAGSVVGTADGAIRIGDTPVIGVSWADPDKIMVIDNDFIERIETESLRVEFSYEDSDNFQRNLVTARVECFEDLNILRTEAHSMLDMGNES